MLTILESLVVLLTATAATLIQAQSPTDFGAAAMLKRDKETSPVDHYHGSVSFAIFMCSTARSINESLAESKSLGSEPSTDQLSNADYRACIQRNGESFKKVCDAAIASLRKSDSKAALREHYVQATVSLQGVAPKIDEPRILYMKRQADNEVKFEELWTRFTLTK